MWDVKPGDLVVFVGLDNSTKAEELPFIRNSIYTVREVIISEWPGHVGEVGIVTEEIGMLLVFDFISMAASIKAFRPVSKTRTEEFRRLVAPTKTKEVEHV